ncbi:ParB N-terminal domain-containing protein [Vibrio owensii]|uniref:ParB N-terminal domain-containing protein n=1 Tax=Vibrio owensii TaxID=696485 RepID=UPI003395CD44
MQEPQNIPLESVVVDARTQHRRETNYGHIQNIRDSILDGQKIPPISVVKATDLDSEQYYLIDGFHRVEAHFKAGSCNIRANVMKEGVLDDAIYLSLSANAEHDQTLVRLNPDIVNAAEIAAELIFDKKKNLNRNSFDFRPYPKVEIDEVMSAVKCTARIAKPVCQKFNNRIKEIRNKSIYEEVFEGRPHIDVATRHDVSVSTVKNVVEAVNKRNEYESNRGSGWSRQRNIEYDYNTQDGESGYKGKSRFNHRFSEPDFEVEADLVEFLLKHHFFDGNKNSTELFCVTGRVDILTDNEIVEVKRTLTRKNIQLAIGQLMLYKNFFKNRKLTIAGMFHNDLRTLGEHIGNIGIDVVVIYADGKIERIVKGTANGL